MLSETRDNGRQLRSRDANSRSSFITRSRGNTATILLSGHSMVHLEDRFHLARVTENYVREVGGRGVMVRSASATRKRARARETDGSPKRRV